MKTMYSQEDFLKYRSRKHELREKIAETYLDQLDTSLLWHPIKYFKLDAELAETIGEYRALQSAFRRGEF